MRIATVRQAAILTGGLGTRLGELTASTPKPLLACGDRPFLAWLLRELSRFGIEEVILLTGHLGDAVETMLPLIRPTFPSRCALSAVASNSPPGLAARCSMPESISRSGSSSAMAIHGSTSISPACWPTQYAIRQTQSVVSPCGVSMTLRAMAWSRWTEIASPVFANGISAANRASSTPVFICLTTACWIRWPRTARWNATSCRRSPRAAHCAAPWPTAILSISASQRI